MPCGPIPSWPPRISTSAKSMAGSGRINEAIDHYREALRLDPDFALAHYFLGLALLAKGRRDEVDEDYPVGVESLNHFRGSAMNEADRLLLASLRLSTPNGSRPGTASASPRRTSARLDEAIDHYRQAIRLDPRRFDLPTGPSARRCWPNGSSPKRTPPSAAVSTSSRPRKRRRRENLERLRQRCRHLLALEGRLPAVVQGKDKPAAADCLDLAELCFVKKHYATAARLYAEALAATPRLTEDLRAGHRFNAARAAALAGGGHGDDVAGLGEPEREGLRKQARDWLRLDLAAWAKKVDTGTEADRIQARKTLAPWRDDPDLAAMRDPAALGKLPPAERQECRALWRDFDALLERAQGPGK